MRKIFSICMIAMITMVSCQKEAAQVAKNPVNNGSGVVNTSTIKGVSMIKDGNPYPNFSSSNGFADDEIGWFLDLGAVQSGYTANPMGPLANNLGDASLYCGGIQTVTLYAGQTITMGTLTYANDANNLYITYTTDADWYMTEVHLYVGSKALTPLSGGGTPSPGRFPIGSTFSKSNLAQTVNYTIPLSSLPTSGVIIAAHAAVIRADVDGDVVAKETAWAAGTRFQSNKNWATYVNATISTCGGGPILGDLTKSNTGTN